MTVDNAVEIPQEYRSPEGMRTLANYLRSHIRVKSGIEHEKRVEYFKGIRLVECVLEAKKWPKSIPKITDARVAVEVADLLLQSHFFHRSEKVKDKKGYLKISQKTVFEEKGYYTWIFVGNMMWSNIATGLVIAVVIGFTLLPIWPDAAKKVLWYFSVTFLIGTLAFCLIRVIAFIVMWILGYDFWIFPRLFDESLSFQDSFKPIYSFDKGSAGQGYYRLGMIVLLTGFTYWAYTQPTEFDGFIQAQKEFIDDLYSGKLIADVAFDPRDQIDRNKKVPSLQDLLKELENDEKSITEKATEVEEEGNVEALNNVNSDSSNEDNEGSGEFIYVDTESSTVEN